MTKKVSEDMYPLNELRKKFGHRIRTTAFSNKKDNILVSFKLFSNIVASLKVSEDYAEVIEKALSNVAFYTEGGYHKLNEVDYMFIDDNNLNVAVLKNGKDYTLLCPPEKGETTPLKAKSPLFCRVSTLQLKEYYSKHISQFPYLNLMAKEIDKFNIHGSISSNIPHVAQRCLQNEWIRLNISECINELSKLLDNASFVLNSTK